MLTSITCPEERETGEQCMPSYQTSMPPTSPSESRHTAREYLGQRRGERQFAHFVPAPSPTFRVQTLFSPVSPRRPFLPAFLPGSAISPRVSPRFGSSAGVPPRFDLSPGFSPRLSPFSRFSSPFWPFLRVLLPAFTSAQQLNLPEREEHALVTIPT